MRAVSIDALGHNPGSATGVVDARLDLVLGRPPQAIVGQLAFSNDAHVTYRRRQYLPAAAMATSSARAILPGMSAPAVKRLTVPEFLSWVETQDRGRFELVRGEVVAMAPERAEHVQAKLAAAVALRDAVRRAGVDCRAFVEGLSVVIDDETTYVPDALVICGGPLASSSLIAPHPVIVVEVLSPSSRRIDTTAKLADYFRVPGLTHYLVIDLARRHAVHYRRLTDGTIALAIVRDGEIVFDPPGITVAAAALFE
jgi:Uma2 family endonuclease